MNEKPTSRLFLPNSPPPDSRIIVPVYNAPSVTPGQIHQTAGLFVPEWAAAAILAGKRKEEE